MALPKAPGTSWIDPEASWHDRRASGEKATGASEAICSQIFSNISERTATRSPSYTLISLRPPADDDFKFPLVR
jgi:hypothetical protein